MVGLICFANDSGIGYQTKRLAEMIKPDRLLVVDSNSFSKNKLQHFNWYDNFKGYRVNGFPTDNEVRIFLNGLTHIICVENPLNYNLTAIAKSMGIKVYIQTNFEFCDFLNKPQLTLPEKFIMPSYWQITEMERIFGKEKVGYLPPPVDPQEFKEARAKNLERTGGRRFLHIAGTIAVHDRNGTLDLIHAVERTTEEFSLVIKSQHELPQEYMSQNSKISYQFGNTISPVDLYSDFDALILPRRYGGLSLPVCEGLMSALPVIMPNISPNNKLLPLNWLVPARKIGEFQARTKIDIHQVDIEALAFKLDWLTRHDIATDKLLAFELGHKNFSPSVLRERYQTLWT